MTTDSGKKNLNIHILKMLEEKTDEKHVLSQKAMADALDCNRHTVKSNIDALCDLGYKIISTPKGSYLQKKTFDDAELRMLIDSVLFSKNLSQVEKKSLIEKLRGMGTEYSKKKLPRTTALKDMFHSENDETFDSLKVINDAIADGKKIQFVYNSYGIDFKLHPRRDEPYKVSPYQLLATNGRYYLLGNYDKYNDISHYRVDRITRAEILNETVKPTKKVEGFTQGQLNLPDYIRQRIYMYSDAGVRIKFLANVEMMDELVDWFGKNFIVQKLNDKKIRVIVTCNEHAMIYWALQYGKDIVIEHPKTLIESVKNIAKKIVADYED